VHVIFATVTDRKVYILALPTFFCTSTEIYPRKHLADRKAFASANSPSTNLSSRAKRSSYP